MNRLNRDQILRLSIALALLFSGVALIPFVDLPTGAIGWESLASVYTPALSANETTGAPGSRFAFSGSDYPPDSAATVYFDGATLGQVMTDAQGAAAFVLDTTGAEPGSYNVTLEVDGNASATESIELIDGGATVTPPAGFTGPTVYVNPPTFLPIVYGD